MFIIIIIFKSLHNFIFNIYYYIKVIFGDRRETVIFVGDKASLGGLNYYLTFLYVLWILDIIY